MRHAVISGAGMRLPPIAATNEDIYNFLVKPKDEPRWTPDWVRTKLGIVTRRTSLDFAAGRLLPGFSDLDNATAAAHEALNDAGLHPSDLDRVIWATTTPEVLLPDPACLLHERLGMRPTASAIGMTCVGCGGFLYALDAADSDIRAGKAERVLVVGSLVVAPYFASSLEMPPGEKEAYQDVSRPSAYIFGEGAGAMVVEATRNVEGIVRSRVGASTQNNPITYLGGGSRHPATHETVRQNLHVFDMNTRLVATVAPTLFGNAMKEMVRSTGVTPDRFDRIIMHQVNLRTLELLAKQNNLPMDRIEIHVERYGNLDTATMPVAFCEAKRAGKLTSGDLVLFAGVGAGWQYGTIIYRVP